jgi:hypothetical protein
MVLLLLQMGSIHRQKGAIPSLFLTLAALMADRVFVCKIPCGGGAGMVIANHK